MRFGPIGCSHPHFPYGLVGIGNEYPILLQFIHQAVIARGDAGLSFILQMFPEFVETTFDHQPQVSVTDPTRRPNGYAFRYIDG